MIRKTVRVFKRSAKSFPDRRLSDERHTERVVRETWWFLWVLPVYQHDEVTHCNL
jgi:hypothetical protein